MKQLSSGGKTLKHCSFNFKNKQAGRNSSGSITMFHRGGGSKRLLRRIDFKRNVLSVGFVERIEYDPNRSARIALVRWSCRTFGKTTNAGSPSECVLRSNTHWEAFISRSETEVARSSAAGQLVTRGTRGQTAALTVGPSEPTSCPTQAQRGDRSRQHFSMFAYILACDQQKVGDMVINLQGSSSMRHSECVQTTSSNSKNSTSLLSFTMPQWARKGSTLNLRTCAALWVLKTEASGEIHVDALPKWHMQNASLIDKPVGPLRLKGDTEFPAETNALPWLSSVKRSDPTGVGVSDPNDRSSAAGQLLTLMSFRKALNQVARSVGTERSLPSAWSRRITAQRYRLSISPKDSEYWKMSDSSSTPLGQSLPKATLTALDGLTALDQDNNHKMFMHEKLYQQVGSCIPLRHIAVGTNVHNIEIHPGQGGKLARSAGASAQLVQKPVGPLGFNETPLYCLVRLPSGILKQVDSRCRATVGIVSNVAHSTRKLTKAGQNRWLGKRPVVRGVAMNPIDHPHGGGEGRTKGGRPSVSPWGKPTKGGYNTVLRKKTIIR